MGRAVGRSPRVGVVQRVLPSWVRPKARCRLEVGVGQRQLVSGQADCHTVVAGETIEHATVRLLVKSHGFPEPGV